MRHLVLCSAVMLSLALPSAEAAEKFPAPPAPPAFPLPGRIVAACAGAKGEMAFVCSDYARVFRENETQRWRAQEAARKAEERLREQTRGGVVESLR